MGENKAIRDRENDLLPFCEEICDKTLKFELLSLSSLSESRKEVDSNVPKWSCVAGDGA